jgi:3-oxoacid CoA-transferase A subunit
MPIQEIIDAKTAAGLVRRGDRIMLPAFLAVGSAPNLIDALVEAGTGDLHIICIATDYADRGIGKLVTNKQVRSTQTSHIGTNQSSQEQYTSGDLEIEFIPQGTLIERIRAAGSGLGGILTPVGIGTDIEKGKEILEIDGERYFLEKPIFADFAFIRAHKADKFGNLIYSKTARNANPVMAMAVKITIAEVDEIVEPGELDPEHIITPGIFVNYLVLHKE